MQISGLTNSSNSMQGNQDSLKSLEQKKIAIETQIAQMKVQDSEKNSDKIEKLEKQLDAVKTEITQAQGASNANYINSSNNESSNNALEEKIGPAYEVDISNQAKSLQEEQLEANKELTKSDEEKMLKKRICDKL